MLVEGEPAEPLRQEQEGFQDQEGNDAAIRGGAETSGGGLLRGRRSCPQYTRDRPAIEQVDDRQSPTFSDLAAPQLHLPSGVSSYILRVYVPLEQSMTKTLIRHGNSLALVIDKPILEMLQIRPTRRWN